MINYSPKVTEPFHKLGSVVFVKLDVGKVDLKNRRTGIARVEEHQLCLAQMNWC